MISLRMLVLRLAGSSVCVFCRVRLLRPVLFIMAHKQTTRVAFVWCSFITYSAAYSLAVVRPIDGWLMLQSHD